MTDETRTFDEEYEWLKHWSIGRPIISGSADSCNSWAEQSGQNWLQDTSSHKQLDYTICGTKEGGGDCKQVNRRTWDQIWANCHGMASTDQSKAGEDGKNFDPCWNMITSNEAHTPGGDFEADSDTGTYNPRTGRWSNDDSSDDQGNYDHEDGRWQREWRTAHSSAFAGSSSQLGPAYPTDVAPISGHIVADQDLEDMRQCPPSHPRSFACHGDGESIGPDEPGCGMKRKGIDDLDDVIRFCAKDNRHYNTLNVMECCMGPLEGGPGKGDPDTAGSQYTECPTDYCRTSRDIDDIPNNECEVMDDEGKCFQLSDKCNDVFVNVCTQREMWGNEGEDSIETSNKKEYCRKWAKINPTKFKQFADGICKFPTGAGGNALSGTALAEKLQTDSVARKRVKDLYNSDLCSDYLLTSSEHATTLIDVCSAAVEPSKPGEKDIGPLYGGPWTETDFGKDMGHLCKCYYPENYYNWYKATQLPSSEGGQSSLSTMINPQCFHLDCARSGYYSLEGNTECPSIEVCINSVEQNQVFLGGAAERSLGTSTRQPASVSVCNFSTLTDAASGAAPPPTPGAPPTPRAPPTPGATPGAYPPPMYDPYNRERGTSNRKDDDDDNDMLMIGGIAVVCCGFMMMMMMMSMKGGGGGGYPMMMR